jgi:thiamine-phosphate pyrophosphorylase
LASLRDGRLYGILDLAYVAPEEAVRVAGEMIDGGVDILQLRGKKNSAAELESVAADLRTVTVKRSVPLIANDYPKIARSVGADGVHVGQDDLSVNEARRQGGGQLLVGKSTHSLAQARAAAEEGADYIGFGPLFATPTKPDYKPIGLTDIAEAHRIIKVPIFCIGGIKLENLAQVIAAGARRVVIVSNLLCAPDVADYARACKEVLEEKCRIPNDE